MCIRDRLVNMLYNIVDRIYIGHIPETGSMAASMENQKNSPDTPNRAYSRR